jgi:hypothetical protein
MSSKIVVSLAVALALAPLAVSAASPSYNYVDIGYASVDLDDGPSLDGYGLDASIALNDNFHLVAGYAEVSKSPVTLTTGTVGLGYNYAMTGTTDLVARVAWVNARLKASGLGSASDDGWSAQAGARSMLTEQFELNGFINYVDVFDDSETSLEFGGVYHFTEVVGLGASVDFADDATSWFVGLRLSF